MVQVNWSKEYTDLTADPGVASSVPAQSHTFVEIDHEIISTVILFPSAESFKKGCCQLQAKVCARSTGKLLVQAQELEFRSLYHLYSLRTKSSRCHYIVMTRSETKLLVAIPAPVSGQSAVNVATATSKCSITFLLPYDQNGDVKTKQDNVSNIL